MRSDHDRRARHAVERRCVAPAALMRLLFGAGSLVLPCGVVSAQAQTTETATLADDAIIVTAQRRAEALEDVPMTVAVINSATLERSGVTSLRDIANVTTGFQLGQGGAYPQPAIRGVTTLLNGTFENNVAVYVDGFYQVAAQSINIDLPNVEAIQILKGPQGTLYGRNATGGAILLSTIAPGDSWQGKGEVTYARFDDRRASAYVAGPLNDSVGVSIAGYIRRSDGYHKLASRTVPGTISGNASPLEQTSLRLKTKIDVTEALTATVAYNYVHVSDPRGNMFTPFENVAGLYNVLPGGNTRPTKLGVAAWDYAAETESKQHEGTLKLALDTGIGTLTSYTGYSKFEPVTSFDFDGSYANTGWNTSRFDQRTFQQAVDFAVEAVKNVDLIVGGLYFHDSLRQVYNESYVVRSPAPSVTVPPSFSSLALGQRGTGKQIKEAWAIYGDATLHILPDLSLNFGGRYSRENQDLEAQTVSGAGAVILPLSKVGGEFSKFTPRASIRYELAPRTNVYASYSKGFRSGAFPGGPPNNDLTLWVPARQEQVDAFEIGFKTAQRSLRVEVAGFYYKYKDLQVSATIPDPTCPAGAPCNRVITLLQNAPTAKIYGLEGSFEYEPIERLTLRGGALWLHARYGDNTFYTGTGVNPATRGINTNSDPLKTYVNVTQIAQDISGLQLSRAPNFSANLGVDYLVPMGEGGVRFAVNAKYTDSYVVTNPSIWGTAAGVPADRQRKQRFREGKYALLNASITWTDSTDNLFVRLWGNNLTDHRYRLHYAGTASFGTYSPLAEPLTYGATIGYKFGR
jgi:iron complex outermembrane recepter protein